MFLTVIFISLINLLQFESQKIVKNNFFKKKNARLTLVSLSTVLNFPRQDINIHRYSYQCSLLILRELDLRKKRPV